MSTPASAASGAERERVHSESFTFSSVDGDGARYNLEDLCTWIAREEGGALPPAPAPAELEDASDEGAATSGASDDDDDDDDDDEEEEAAASARGEEPWRDMYGRLVAYREEHGHCLVARTHASADGPCLGAWVAVQRANYKAGLLSARKIAALRDLGFIWDAAARVEARWPLALAALEAFKEANGHCIVPKAFVTAGGLRLGAWCKNQRDIRSRGGLSEEKRKALDAAGFAWDENEAKWRLNFGLLQDYAKENGDAHVPRAHITPKGVKLGLWVSRQREYQKKTTLSADRVADLETLGFRWSASDAQRNYTYAQRTVTAGPAVVAADAKRAAPDGAPAAAEKRPRTSTPEPPDA